ncbi:MAG: DUF4242 domain-containing protein [Caulobacteraceae bacterium]
MKTYVIEREIPGVHTLTAEQAKGAAATSNAALAKLGPEVQWVTSYVTNDKTFCIYRAENEEVIRKHAELSGFPANKISEVSGNLDPTSAG